MRGHLSGSQGIEGNKKDTYVQQPKEVQFPMIFGAVGEEEEEPDPPEQVEMSACSAEVRCVPCARHIATR